MRTPCCHTILAFILKFLNFLQAFIGVVLIVYSAYVLNQWNHHHDLFQPPNQVGIHLPADINDPLNLASGVISSQNDALSFNFHSLPAPWFAYATMGIGILVCFITLIGHIGTETMSGCCLCFYAILTMMFILLEVGLVAFIAFDHHWQKDIPFDPTGELDDFRNFIEENVDVFEWIGIATLTIQVISLLIAVVLGSLVSSWGVDEDIEGDYGVSSRNREPLLPSPTFGSVRGDFDIWSSRMRQKYGLNSGDAKLNQNASADVNKQ